MMKKVLMLSLALSAVFLSGCLKEYRVTSATSEADKKSFLYMSSAAGIVKIKAGTKLVGYVDEEAGILLTAEITVKGKTVSKTIIEEPFDGNQKFTYQCDSSECYYEMKNAMNGDTLIKFVKGSKEIKALFIRQSNQLVLGQIVLEEI